MPPMDRARVASLALLTAALAACGESGPGPGPRVAIAPLLDSLFVGDTLPPRAVTYINSRGDTQLPGPVRWASSDTSVFSVDSLTGSIIGKGRGVALVSARTNGVSGLALLAVSRTVDVTLLLDTIYLMPGDAFTVPVDVRAKSGGTPTIWFRTPDNPSFTVDSATGRDTAIVVGAARPFYVFAALGPDTVADTGATEVVELSDTLGGKGYFTVYGTVVQRSRGGARAVNYRRRGDTLTFRVSLPIYVNTVVASNVVITLRDSVNAAGTFPIDSISIDEAFGAGADAICRPKRPWALWTLQTSGVLHGFSRAGGSLTITQVASVLHGRAISGRFTFTGQRPDYYNDPVGALPIRGTFVAPLIADNRATCGS
jgi:hypothetical protein